MIHHRFDDISKVNRRKVTSGFPQQIVQASAWRNACVPFQNEWNECEEVCSVSQVGSMAGPNAKVNFVLATGHHPLSNHR